jgi:hypothetical protein
MSAVILLPPADPVMTAGNDTQGATGYTGLACLKHPQATINWN